MTKTKKEPGANRKNSAEKEILPPMSIGRNTDGYRAYHKHLAGEKLRSEKKQKGNEN